MDGNPSQFKKHTVKCKMCKAKTTAWGGYPTRCDKCGSFALDRLPLDEGEPP